MQPAGKQVLVLGLARTGVACARFLAERGARVRVNDRRSEGELRAEVVSLSGFPIEYLLGREDESVIEGCDLVVTSPGVAADNCLLLRAVARGVPVLSEIELAFQFLKAPLLAITGTNGKTTTATLTGELLKAAGKRTFVGGNIGAPLIGFAGADWDWGVVEVSSFQLEWVTRFRPRIAVMLNVTPDHLDRYPDFAAYAAAKERLFAAQSESDVAILNRDDPVVWAMRERLRARVFSFGFSETVSGMLARPDEIIRRDNDTEERYPLERVRLHGVHNIENMMAAIAAARCAGVLPAAIQQTIEAFSGLEHRLEFIREKDGVRYYNDSKGTNVGAVIKALGSFTAPVILIAGGVDKGGDYRVLRGPVRSRVRRLVLFGAAKHLIAAALGTETEAVLVDTLEHAVRDAAAHARVGDVVLLSPGCASFDMFRDYAERGRTFKTLVQAL